MLQRGGYRGFQARVFNADTIQYGTNVTVVTIPNLNLQFNVWMANFQAHFRPKFNILKKVLSCTSLQCNKLQSVMPTEKQSTYDMTQ